MSKITWDKILTADDISQAPADVDSPNYIDSVTSKKYLALSANFSGGLDPYVLVDILFFDEVSTSFKKTGISVTLREDSNLELIEPLGMPFGLIGSVHGDPLDFTLQVGSL